MHLILNMKLENIFSNETRGGWDTKTLQNINVDMRTQIDIICDL